MKRIRIGYVLTALLLCMMGLTCSALADPAAAPRYGNAPDPSLWHPMRPTVTSFGHSIDTLYYGILILTGIVFVIVEALLVYFAIRYRAVPGGKAKFIHGNNRLEAFWTIIPTCIFIFIAGISKHTWDVVREDMPEGPDTVKIECIAQQFSWNFRYAGADGTFGPRNTDSLAEARAKGDTSDPWHVDLQAKPAAWTGDAPGLDDYTNSGEVRIPSDTDVRLILTSNDVIHSFFVPEFRIKHDAVPGMNGGRIWFNVKWDDAKNHGYFDIACAELCGLNHFSMRGKLVVMPKGDGKIDPAYAEKSGADLMAARDADPDAFNAKLDSENWITWETVKSRITAAEHAESGGGYGY